MTLEEMSRGRRFIPHILLFCVVAMWVGLIGSLIGRELGVAMILAVIVGWIVGWYAAVDTTIGPDR